MCAAGRHPAEAISTTCRAWWMIRAVAPQIMRPLYAYAGVVLMPSPSTIEIVLPDSGREIVAKGTFTTSATSLLDNDIDSWDNNLPTNGHTKKPVRVFTGSRAPQWRISAGSTPSSSTVSRRAVCLRDSSAGSQTPPGKAHSFRWWRTSSDRLIRSNSGPSSRPPEEQVHRCNSPGPGVFAIERRRICLPSPKDIAKRGKCRRHASYGKMDETTSSRLRWICGSSVIPQVTDTWQARLA